MVGRRGLVILGGGRTRLFQKDTVGNTHLRSVTTGSKRSRGSARNNRQKCSRLRLSVSAHTCEPFAPRVNIQQVKFFRACGAAPQAGEAMRFKAGAGKVGGRTLPIRKGWVGGRTRFGTRTTGSTWANKANDSGQRSSLPPAAVNIKTQHTHHICCASRTADAMGVFSLTEK